jgi:hypothetical protein
MDEYASLQAQPFTDVGLQVQILCNDCRTTGLVPLHFIGLKCPSPQVGIAHTTTKYCTSLLESWYFP